MNWDKFYAVNEKWLPSYGEGDNMATQIATAVNKLIFKWLNDGDVFDNTYFLAGWANDLSSYANWLYHYAGAVCLLEIRDIDSEEGYTQLLAKLAETYLVPSILTTYEGKPAIGSVYSCEGPFEYREKEEDEDEDEDY